jgi:Spy/CpxP family protein refolding chaperone
MFLRKSLLGVTGIILAAGMIAFAQEPQPQNPASPDGALRKERMEQRRERLGERLGEREGLGRHKGRDGMGRRGPGMGHLPHELNLSDAQREQSRAIMQRRLESTKVQREELFKLREKRIAGSFSAEDGARAKALHEQMRAAMEGARTEMEGVLTAEQKAKLEGFKAERKARHEQRVKEHGERSKERGERFKERRELMNKPQ